MPATEAFSLEPPTDDDLDAAHAAWDAGTTCYTLTPDEVWWRVLKAESPDQASQFASTWYPSQSRGRFTPIEQSGEIIPSAYAGSTQQISIWEVVLRNVRHQGIRRIPQHEIDDRYLLSVRAHRPLRLLNIRRPQDAHLVAVGKRPPDLTAAWPQGYPVTASWAQALRERIPELDGILYESHQIAGHCAVLYRRPGITPPLFHIESAAQRMTAAPVRALLLEEAAKAGVAVDFGDDF